MERFDQTLPLLTSKKSDSSNKLVIQRQVKGQSQSHMPVKFAVHDIGSVIPNKGNKGINSSNGSSVLNLTKTFAKPLSNSRPISKQRVIVLNRSTQRVINNNMMVNESNKEDLNNNIKLHKLNTPSSNLSFITIEPPKSNSTNSLLNVILNANSQNTVKVITATNFSKAKDKLTNYCDICEKTISSNIYKFHKNTHPSKIFDWLYLGGYTNAMSLQELQKLNVTHVLNCALECKNVYPEKFTYKKLWLSDQPKQMLKTSIKQACDFLEEVRHVGGVVYVHCMVGKSRSVSNGYSISH